MQLVGAIDGRCFADSSSRDSPPGFWPEKVWLDIQNRRCGIISVRRFLFFKKMFCLFLP
jgi:hypothetical protein